MNKTGRLELTFGKKDADIEAYIESFGLPKAPLVKKMIREHMIANAAGIQQIPAATEQAIDHSVEVKTQVQNTEKNEPEVVEEQKNKSLFGSLAIKK